ncbi:MAG: hypothetical protein K2X93_21090 [Candidatus Obscuribacterales bacterium]|nr:hypothetical protein [Candidatus Obscuribacterales bacterium]
MDGRQLRQAYVDLGIDQQDQDFVRLYVPISFEEMQAAIVSAETAKQLAFGKNALKAYKSFFLLLIVCCCSTRAGRRWRKEG